MKSDYITEDQVTVSASLYIYQPAGTQCEGRVAFEVLRRAHSLVLGKSVNALCGNT